MVHARAFSFTDDSASVIYPSASGMSNPSALGNILAGPKSMDTALTLFQLRYAQSNWYQELFQSSRDPLPNASHYVWQMCHEMREWFDSLPETLPANFRDMFELELLYSYVYCLAPSCRVLTVSAYGKTLIFEYSITYMQKMFQITQDPQNKAFYTYHDALRVYFVGSQFNAVLIDSQDQLLNRIIPFEQLVPGSPPPPPLPPSSGGANNIDRSINCIVQIKEILHTFGRRWDDSNALLSSFEMQAQPLLASLYQRKNPFDGLSQHNSPPAFLPHNTFETVSQYSDNNWQHLSPPFSGNEGNQVSRQRSRSPY